MSNDNQTPTPEAIRALGNAITLAGKNAEAKMTAVGRSFNEAIEAARESRQ